jgi:hypothetical protein
MRFPVLHQILFNNMCRVYSFLWNFGSSCLWSRSVPVNAARRRFRIRENVFAPGTWYELTFVLCLLFYCRVLWTSEVLYVMECVSWAGSNTCPVDRQPRSFIKWMPSGMLRTFDGSSKHLWNVGQFLPHCTAQRLRRQSSSYLLPWEPEYVRYTGGSEVGSESLCLQLVRRRKRGLKREMGGHIEKRLVLNNIYFGVGLFLWYLTSLFQLQRLCVVGYYR